MKLVAWIAAALAHGDAPPVPPDAKLPPVILVHGIFSSAADMVRLTKALRAHGREVFTPTLEPSNGKAQIENLAEQLADFAEQKVPGRKFDLVGFSMGGLISRYYVQRLGGVNRVEHLVTIAAPHHGTLMAHFFPGSGCEQMRPGSSFLLDLERDADTLRAIPFTSYRTPLDLVVFPARNSVMAQAKNVRIWASLHPSFILEKRCIRAITDALKASESPH